MAPHALEDSMAGVSAGRSGGGWKSLFWLAVAAAGVGFAGYVFLVPYQRIQSSLLTLSAELEAQRTSAEGAAAERDKLKAQVTTFNAAADEKSAAEARRKADLEAITAQLKPVLEELGATIASGAGHAGGGGGSLLISFPGAKVIDPNGIDVSEGGLVALKILAGAVKKGNANARVLAHASSAAPPRELKSLFHTAGEVQTVRAARVMSALEDAGVAPTHITIVGQVEKAPPPHPRGKKPAPPVPVRLDIEVEPE